MTFPAPARHRGSGFRSSARLSAFVIPLLAGALLAAPSLLASPATTTGRGLPQAPAEQPAVSYPARTWTGPDGKPLPFKDDAEVMDFLRTAEIVDTENIPVGITRPRRLVLERDGVRARAILRDLKSEQRGAKVGGRVFPIYRDDYMSECAAYEVAVLLGLDNVPPVVPRTVRRKNTSVQIWVENAPTLEELGGAKAPDAIAWTRQLWTMRLFDNLIYNHDRNPGNMLVDENWKLWMIDHTRAFQRLHELLNPAQIVLVDRNVWDRLQALDEQLLRERLGPYLAGLEIKALEERRKLLVGHIQELIDVRGEDVVLY